MLVLENLFVMDEVHQRKKLQRIRQRLKKEKRKGDL